MLGYLERTQGGQPGSIVTDLNGLGKAVDDLLTDAYLSPGQRAALYELLARTPGFTVVPHAADVSGRCGVGVSWPFLGGSKTMILFDSATYAELGLTTWGSGQYRGDEGAARCSSSPLLTESANCRDRSGGRSSGFAHDQFGVQDDVRGLLTSPGDQAQ